MGSEWRKHSKSSAKASAVWYLLAGSFSRAFKTIVSRSRGTNRSSILKGGGSASRI
jgi:hypothetical protein